jgi:alginate O-acetyltransferase complex protein AlgI
MNDSTALIIFGFFVAIIYLCIKPKAAIKKYFLMAASVYFFYYINNLTWLLIAFSWVGIIFLINLFPAKKLVYFYVIAVSTVFCLLKLDFFSFGEKNLLTEIAIPTGTSFILFQSISLLLNRSSGLLSQPTSFVSTLSGLIFFPSIIVGPFYKIQEYLKGLQTAYDANRVYTGFFLFSSGLFKFAFASSLEGNWALKKMPLVFIDDLHSLTTLLAASIYLYANFSGISDIAVGIGKMLGFDLPRNFKFPFVSVSMSEFWRKWHITLGAWFKENIYFPINFILSKKISYKTSSRLGIFVTFLLIGLWHQFSFKIFIYSVVNSILVTFFSFENLSGFKKTISYISTFFLILLVNGLFLSKDLSTFYEFLYKIFDIDSRLNVPKNIFLGAGLIIALLYFYFVEKFIDKMDSEADSIWIFPVNLIFTAINLFLGISIGLGGANAIYKGY